MKVAFVYDRVNKFGGAERLLQVLHEIWPEAPLYTAVYNLKTAPWAKDFQVIPSFLQRFPLAKTWHEIYPWLMPLAFESFNFDDYDIVISVTSEAAKGILTKAETLHICYCLTPTRYLWSGYKDYFPSYALRFLSFPLISYLRHWDQLAAQRPDIYLATCKNVEERIKQYYHRKAEVIYPAIDTAKWKIKNEGERKEKGYFLIVSRLVPYKRVDIAIRAFNRLDLPLKIVGTGREEGRLKKMAKGNIEFLGQLTDQTLLRYYGECKAVIFPQEEDFGLVPLEAQSCGKPVIAYRGGGALETVIEGRTGEFFYPQTAEALAEKILRCKEKILKGKYKPEDCRRQAEKFDIKIFKKKFKEFVERIWKNSKKSIYMF